nr:MAG TPA: hypothetical protein [Caudoviricetes sp.]
MILNASIKEHGGMEWPTYDEIISTWNKEKISLTSGTSVRMPNNVSVFAFCGEYRGPHFYLIPASQVSDGGKTLTIPFTDDAYSDYLFGMMDFYNEGRFIDINFTFEDGSTTAASGGFFCAPYVYYKTE